MSRWQDWSIDGHWPLQHHAPDRSVTDRLGMSAGRAHADEGDEIAPAKGTYGDILGGFLWLENQGARDYLNAWWLTGCGVVYDGNKAAGGGESGASTGGGPEELTAPDPPPPAAAETTADSGQTRERAPSTTGTTSERSGATGDGSVPRGAPGGGATAERDAAVASGKLSAWLPIRELGQPDPRFAPKDFVHPVLADQVWPKGWTGTASSGSDETAQRDLLHPDFLGLVAVNAAGNPAAGTPVFDLLPDGSLDPARYARLQSLVSVEEVASASCGVAGRVLALQGGSSRLDLTSGHLLTVIHGAGKQAAAMSRVAGGPLYAGGPCQHILGALADGTLITSGHLPTDALFRGLNGDGPLDFSLLGYPNPPRAPAKAPVHISWDPSVPHTWCGGTKGGRWRLWAEVPIYVDEGPEDEIEEETTPEDTVVFPPENPDSSLGGGTRERGSSPEKGIGLAVGVGELQQELEKIKARPEVVVGENLPGKAPVATVNMALVVGGGLEFRAFSTRPDEADLTRSVRPRPEDVAKAEEAPLTASFVPYAAGNGTWDGFTYTTRPTSRERGSAAGGVAMLPPGVSIGDVLGGACSSDTTAMLVMPCGISGIGFGLPSLSTGGISAGTTLIRTGAGNAGAVAFKHYTTAGVNDTTAMAVGASVAHYDTGLTTATASEIVDAAVLVIDTDAKTYHALWPDGTSTDLAGGSPGSGTGVDSIMTVNTGSEGTPNWEIVFDGSGNIVLEA